MVHTLSNNRDRRWFRHTLCNTHVPGHSCLRLTFQNFKGTLTSSLARTFSLHRHTSHPSCPRKTALPQRCLSISPDVSQYHQMSFNSSRHLLMSHDASQCHQKLLTKGALSTPARLLSRGPDRVHPGTPPFLQTAPPDYASA